MENILQVITHGLFPYRGKFHPQLIRALLNILKVKKGDVVLDPMAVIFLAELMILKLHCFFRQ